MLPTTRRRRRRGYTVSTRGSPPGDACVALEFGSFSTPDVARSGLRGRGIGENGVTARGRGSDPPVADQNVVEGRKPLLHFGPVVQGPRPNRLKIRQLPDLLADCLPERGQRPPPGLPPAPEAGTPGWLVAPALVARQQQGGIEPGHPVHRTDHASVAPLLLLAEAKAAFEFAVHDLDLPALPGPTQQLLHRQRQPPPSRRARLGGDQQVGRFPPPPSALLGVCL